MRKRVAAYNTSFHATGITGSAGNAKHEPRRRTAHKYGWKLQTLSETQKALGHVGRRLNYLKVDVEASEWGVFPWANFDFIGGLWSVGERRLDPTVEEPRIKNDRIARGIMQPHICVSLKALSRRRSCLRKCVQTPCLQGAPNHVFSWRSYVSPARPLARRRLRCGLESRRQ